MRHKQHKMPPSTSSTSISYLDRILGVFSSYSFFTTSLDPPQTTTTTTTTTRVRKRRYGLSPKAKYFVIDELGLSLSPFLFFQEDKVNLEERHHLDKAVLDGGNPFLKAHGDLVYHYAADNPRYSHILQQAMANHSFLFMNDFLKAYRGFDEVKGGNDGGATLVDLGGGSGACLNMIVSKYPNIRGINFDLPHVVSSSPSFPGVEHIGGDMFESVPIADIIFMKWILHNWEDEKCVKILTNCQKALKPGGKVILVESILLEVVETELSSHIKLLLDLVMLIRSPSGKLRTKDEFEQLAIRT